MMTIMRISMVGIIWIRRSRWISIRYRKRIFGMRLKVMFYYRFCAEKTLISHTQIQLTHTALAQGCQKTMDSQMYDSNLKYQIQTKSIG